MNTITITDTHKKIESLQTKGGASKELAEQIIETIQAAELKQEPASKADVKDSENRMIMWVIGAQVAGTGLLLATKFFG